VKNLWQRGLSPNAYIAVVPDDTVALDSGQLPHQIAGPCLASAPGTFCRLAGFALGIGPDLPEVVMRRGFARRGFPLIVFLLAATAACSSTASSSSSSTSTTAPSAAVTTEIFPGTVIVGGNDVHPFNVVVSGGQVTVNLTAAGPPSTIYMGVGVGTYVSPTCTLITGSSVVTAAGATAQLSGAAAAGSYCVEVYDAGNQTAPVTYSVTVTHY
jgi:hypothetical protein